MFILSILLIRQTPDSPLTIVNRRIEETMGRLLKMAGPGSSSNVSINQQFVAQFSQQMFAQDLRKELHGSGHLPLLMPERASISADQLLAAIEQFSAKLDFSMVRQQPVQANLSRQHPGAKGGTTQDDIQTIVSVSEWAEGLVDEALKYSHQDFLDQPPLRIKDVGVQAGDHASFTLSEPPEQAIARLRQDWDHRKERTRFRFIHTASQQSSDRPQDNVVKGLVTVWVT